MKKNAGVPWPEPSSEPGGSSYKPVLPGGSKPGGPSMSGPAPLKRVVEPGSALRTMKKRANPKPVAPKVAK